MEWDGLDSCASGYGPVAGSFEQGNKPSGSIKRLGNFWVVKRLLTSQEGLGSMESVCTFLIRYIKNIIWSKCPINNKINNNCRITNDENMCRPQPGLNKFWFIFRVVMIMNAVTHFKFSTWLVTCSRTPLTAAELGSVMSGTRHASSYLSKDTAWLH